MGQVQINHVDRLGGALVFCFRAQMISLTVSTFLYLGHGIY